MVKTCNNGLKMRLYIVKMDKIEPRFPFPMRNGYDTFGLGETCKWMAHVKPLVENMNFGGGIPLENVNKIKSLRG